MAYIDNNLPAFCPLPHIAPSIVFVREELLLCGSVRGGAGSLSKLADGCTPAVAEGSMGGADGAALGLGGA